MAISDTQKVDYLWKKIGYSATKTDTTANKDATNEALPSPLQIRGDTLLVQSSSIPGSIPATSTSIVSVYRPDATLEMPQTAIGVNGPAQRGQLGSATAYRTWQTGLQNWISPEFGATYAVRVFLDTAGRTTSNTTGTEIYATASGEEWFFDYQSGVLNFSGNNLPSGISTKSVYISGARYVGEIGISNTVNTGAAAFAQANAAFAAANNATDTYVRNHANAAFIQANTGYNLANSIANNSTIAGTSNVANYVGLQAKSGSNSYYIVLSNAATGNLSLGSNTQLSYNPDSDTLSVQKGSFGQSVTTTSLLASALSVTVFNTTATTINMGGVATTINIGNTGGTTNVKGTLVVNGVSVIGFTQSSYDTANSALNVGDAAFLKANAAFANANSYITYNDAVNVTQNNSIAAAFAAANAATATDTTQNNSITAAFVRANNSLDANNGGTVTGDVIFIGNVTSNSLTTTGSNGSITGANAIFTNYIFAANGAVDLYIYTSRAYDKANAAFASANSIDGINTTQNNSITAAFAAANAATATDATQNNSITAAFIRANNSLDANNGGTIAGDIVIAGNLSCNIVGGTF